MKKLTFSLLFLLPFLTSIAQEISGTLEGVQCVDYKGGILVYGYLSDDDGYSFSITHYGKDLSVISKYSKKISGEVSPVWSYCIQYGDHIDVYTKSKPQSYFIKLSDKLQELSANPIDDVVKASDKALISENNGAIIQVNPVVGFVWSAPEYEKVIENKHFLNDDLVWFDLKKESLIRYKVINGIKLDTYYSLAWETPIKGFDKVKLTGVIHADEKNVVACFITRGKNKYWDDCIVRLDSKTGAIKNTIPVEYPDKELAFFMSNVYYDKETEKIIAAGQLYKGKANPDVVSLAIMIYNKNGVLEMSKNIDFPQNTLDLPNYYKLNDRSCYFLSINKSETGKYEMLIQNNCRRKQNNDPGAGAYHPISFTYLEMDGKGNITSEKNIPYFDKRSAIDVAKSLSPGKFVMLKCLDTRAYGNNPTGIFKTGYINFEGDGEFHEVLKVDEMVLTSNSPFNNAYETDAYKQFAVDKNHVITFFKHAKSNNYELESIQIKK